MHISWLGTTTVKIQVKPFDKDVFLVIDPYRPLTGTFPRSISPDIALFTRGEEGSVTLSSNPFILSTAGECETKGVLIVGAHGDNGEKMVIRVDAESMSIGHLGLISTLPSKSQFDTLYSVDVLFLPVGGKEAFEPEVAMKAVSIISPRIIIPIAYRSDNDPKADSVEPFLKEIGIDPERADKKIIIKKKDLPQEETKVVVVSKE